MTTEQTTRRLVIDRATWRWGGDKSALSKTFGFTELLNRQGFKCCLGFDALACGCDSEEILFAMNPKVVDNPNWLRPESEEWVNSAIRINDNSEPIAQPDRESQLIEHFKSHPMGPVELVFEGEYPEGAL